ncbi:MAG: leucine-rich repeat protein, partial [Clostridia bacterium]|nr:leucine-rich repeat protein [Clostridia bacterium]
MHRLFDRAASPFRGPCQRRNLPFGRGSKPDELLLNKIRPPRSVCFGAVFCFGDLPEEREFEDVGRDDEADIVRSFLDAFKIHPALQFDDLLGRVDPEHLQFFFRGIADDRALVEPADGVVLHVGQKVVGEGAFEGCVSLTRVKLSESIYMIGSGAFSFCFNLTHITIPDSCVLVEF